MQTYRHDIAVLTGTAGTATSYSTFNVSARVLAITISLPTSAALAATSVITIAGAVTAQTIWQKTATGSRTVVPKQKTWTSAGVNFATAAGAPNGESFYLGNERIKVTVAGGASLNASKNATVRVITG